MKKLFIAIAFLAIGNVANAQDMKFGVKGGLNLSDIRFNSHAEGDLAKESDKNFNENAKMRISYHIGAMAEFMLSDAASIQPELLYSTQGYTTKNGDRKTTTSADYITMPIMAKYYPVEGISLEVGPQVGYLMATKQTNNQNDYETDKKEGTNSIDFGVNVGAGYSVNENINIGVRYNYGLSNTVKYSDAEKKAADIVNAKLTTVKNSVIQVSVGYFF